MLVAIPAKIVPWKKLCKRVCSQLRLPRTQGTSYWPQKSNAEWKLVVYKKSIGLVFIAISSGIKSFGTLLSPNLLFLCLTTTYIEYIVIKSHLVNVFNNNRPDSKQTLILPVHIKSQFSYAAITEKFCIRKLYNLWKNSKKARLKKSARKMRMVSRSWQNCLEGPQNCPQGRDFCLFFCPRAVISQKISARGQGIWLP